MLGERGLAPIALAIGRWLADMTCLPKTRIYKEILESLNYDP
jgi:hypothetical protein